MDISNKFPQNDRHKDQRWKKEEACKESQKNIYKQPGTQKHIQIGTKTKHKEARKRKHTRKERSTQGTNKQQINKASK